MQSIDSLIRGWQFPLHASANVATQILSATIDRAGYDSQLFGDESEEGMKLIIVRGADAVDVVLVNAGDEARVRDHARKVQSLNIPGTVRRHLVSSKKVPPDVAHLFGTGPVARLDAELIAADFLNKDLPLTDLPRLVESLVPRYQRQFGIELSPARGLRTLQAIDALLFDVRPRGLRADQPIDPDSVVPISILTGLSAIATEAGRRMVTEAATGAVHMGRFKGVSSFQKSRGKPGLKVGGVVVSLAEVVTQRYVTGQAASLANTWKEFIAKVPEAQKRDPATSLPVTLGSPIADDDVAFWSDEPVAPAAPDEAEAILRNGMRQVIADKLGVPLEAVQVSRGPARNAESKPSEAPGPSVKPAVAAAASEPDPTDDPALQAIMIGLAPKAAEHAVAAADGKMEEREIKAFMPWLDKMESSLLTAALIASPGPNEQFGRLMREPKLITVALIVAGKVFKARGGAGAVAREEIIALAWRVAETNAKGGFLGFGAKKVRPDEQAAVEKVAALLNPE